MRVVKHVLGLFDLTLVDCWANLCLWHSRESCWAHDKAAYATHDRHINFPAQAFANETLDPKPSPVS